VGSSAPRLQLLDIRNIRDMNDTASRIGGIDARELSKNQRRRIDLIALHQLGRVLAN
jgi:hypothetical protein